MAAPPNSSDTAPAAGNLQRMTAIQIDLDEGSTDTDAPLPASQQQQQQHQQQALPQETTKQNPGLLSPRPEKTGSRNKGSKASPAHHRGHRLHRSDETSLINVTNPDDPFAKNPSASHSHHQRHHSTAAPSSRRSLDRNAFSFSHYRNESLEEDDDLVNGPLSTSSRSLRLSLLPAHHTFPHDKELQHALVASSRSLHENSSTPPPLHSPKSPRRPRGHTRNKSVGGQPSQYPVRPSELRSAPNRHHTISAPSGSAPATPANNSHAHARSRTQTQNQTTNSPQPLHQQPDSPFGAFLPARNTTPSPNPEIGPGASTTSATRPAKLPTSARRHQGILVDVDAVLQGAPITHDIDQPAPDFSTSYEQAQDSGLRRVLTGMKQGRTPTVTDHAPSEVDDMSVAKPPPGLSREASLEDADSTDSEEPTEEEIQELDLDAIEPITIRLIHHVHRDKLREYEIFLQYVLSLATAERRCFGVTTLPIKFGRHHRWMIILRFLNQAGYLQWRRDSQVGRLLKALRKQKVFEMGQEEAFCAEVYLGWSVHLQQDLYNREASYNNLLARGYPKYRYLLVMVLSFWVASTLLSIENDTHSWSSYRRDLIEAFDLYDGGSEYIPLAEFLYVLVLCPLAYFVFAPIFEILASCWLNRPVPREPTNSFALYALYRIFVN